jgi:excisionase family DNA binding protein
MLITVSKVAHLLQLAERTVRAMAARNELPCVRTESGMRLFDRAVVERIAAERMARRVDEGTR